MFKRFKAFAAGFISCLILCMGIVATAASTDLIDIKAQINTPVTFKLFGKDFVPKEPTDGSIIKPIIYKGRNYLPVRSISEALGVPIDYDGPAKTIWIGGFERNIKVNDNSLYENSLNTIVTEDAGVLSYPGGIYQWGITNQKILKNGSNFHFYLKPESKFNKFKTTIYLDGEVKKDLIVEFRENDRQGKVIMSATIKPGEKQDIELDIRGINKISVYAFVETAHGQLTRMILGEPYLINEFE